MVVTIIILALLLICSVMINCALYDTILDYREKRWNNKALKPIEWDYTRETGWREDNV